MNRPVESVSFGLDEIDLSILKQLQSTTLSDCTGDL
jgi:hypothetical protein